MVELLLIAVGLAMDAVAVSAGVGASERHARPIWIGAALFGGFQAGMAGLGWWGGLVLAGWATTWAPWIAFLLLTAIGARMMFEAWKGADVARGARPGRGVLAWLALALATSIDALAVGVTLPLLGVPGVMAAIVIGLVTGVLSLGAGFLGQRLGDRFGFPLEFMGGLVLIGIGVHVVIEHLRLLG